jgi:hypothetical protein
MTPRTGAEIIAERKATRKADGWATVADVIAAIPKLDRETLERVATLLAEQASYLDEHNPNGTEVIAPNACSGDTYHLCSFSGRHTDWCALRQEPPEGERATARLCPENCGTSEAPEPWCYCSGFDCEDCETVRELHEIVKAAAG